MDVVHDSQNRRFTATIDGETAELAYVPFYHAIDIVHTVVPKPLQGRGVGAALVEAAFDYARANGLGVKTSCPFAAKWAERHPAVEPLLER